MKREEIVLIVVNNDGKKKKPDCILEINGKQHTLSLDVCRDLYLSWNLNTWKSNDYFKELLKKCYL